MTGQATEDADIAAALRRVATPVGLPGSGRLRYGAAMALHAAGVIGFAALEVYRILAMTDAEDPVRLLAARRLRPPPVPAFDPAAALADLAEAVEARLARHPAGEVAGLRRALAAARLAAPPRQRPAALPCGHAAHLAAALSAADDALLAAALVQAAPALGWGEESGGLAAAPLLGPAAPLTSDLAEIAVILLAPGAGRAGGTPTLWLPLSQGPGAQTPALVLAGRSLPQAPQ